MGDAPPIHLAHRNRDGEIGKSIEILRPGVVTNKQRKASISSKGAFHRQSPFLSVQKYRMRGGCHLWGLTCRVGTTH